MRVMAVVVVRWCMGVPGDSRGRKRGSGLLWVFAISYKPIAVQECMGRMSFSGCSRSALPVPARGCCVSGRLGWVDAGPM